MSEPNRPPRARRVKSPRVALIVETSNAYGRGLLAGIAEYVQTHGPWSVYLPETHRADDTSAARLRGWRGDGVLVRAEDRVTAKAAAACGSAVVDLSAAGLLPQAPAVHSDVRAEAGLAFDHLRERGFRHLGFCGVSDYPWVRWQQERFCELAADAGATVSSFVEPLRLTQARAWTADRNALAAWLRKLPKPVGIFACYDLRGQQVLDACRFAGLRIPDEVAVIGVDDDAVRCSLSDPPLSSVAPDTRRVGYQAAELLTKLMAGERVPPGMQLVPPLGVSARRSTDALAVPDADVAAALQFVRDHCCEPITVQDILDTLHLSRRSLENRFIRLVGRSPHAEVLRCRVERAKQLLMGTDLPIKTIAGRVGVGTPEYLSTLFQRVIGQTPSAYRAQHQPGRLSQVAAEK
ncbi:MAG: substrate-binding domain-containing protein [Tepidisphaeraceae bacterium]